MASYKVIYKASFEKDLRRLPRTLLARVSAQIDKLAENPTPREAVKLQISQGLYRVRIGDYRLVYQVNVRATQIILQRIRHRREVYRSL